LKEIIGVNADVFKLYISKEKKCLTSVVFERNLIENIIQ
jgi:hypothetical protein